jgi:hypothetical protein
VYVVCQTGTSAAGGTDGTVNNGAEEIAFFSCADVNAFEVTEVWSGAFEVTDIGSRIREPTLGLHQPVDHLS